MLYGYLFISYKYQTIFVYREKYICSYNNYYFFNKFTIEKHLIILILKVVIKCQTLEYLKKK